MTDFTAAVEAAARALHEAALARDQQAVEPVPPGPEWDDVPGIMQHVWREHVLPAITAAAPILRAQVLAEAREAVAGQRSDGIVRDGFERGWTRAHAACLKAIDALGAEGAR